ncbi:MAG: GTPase [Streptosporangiaceae bacterium]
MTSGDDDLQARLGPLRAMVELGEDRVDEELLGEARTVLARAHTRLRLSSEHTVVALAGATGSGKSSLFNAISELHLSPVGIRRPTTDATRACVWGLEGARPLLDWLAVDKRHRYARASALDGDAGWSLNGLVLLDLPDHDSVRIAHHLEVDRLVEVADLVVWVLDPQKYADRAIHARYLRTFESHQTVTVVVLNQSDRLAAEARDQCLVDLHGLLEADGLGDVRVFATSVTTGTGVEELRSLLVTEVAERRAWGRRLSADIDRLFERIAVQTWQASPTGIDAARRSLLVGALADAAGVRAAGVSLETVMRERARPYVGWSLATLPRSVFAGRGRRPARSSSRRSMRGSPLLRAGLRDGEVDPTQGTGEKSAGAQQAMVDDAVAQAAESVAAALPGSWGQAVRFAGRSYVDTVPHRLGEVVASARRAGRRTPAWWRVARVVQVMLAVAAAAGLAWVAGLIVFAYLHAGTSPWSVVGQRRFFPYAAGLLVAGLGLGMLAGWIGTRLARGAARRQRGRAEDRMLLDVEGVAHAALFLPVGVELERYARFKEQLASGRRLQGGERASRRPQTAVCPQVP